MRQPHGLPPTQPCFTDFHHPHHPRTAPISAAMARQARRTSRIRAPLLVVNYLLPLQRLVSPPRRDTTHHARAQPMKTAHSWQRSGARTPPVRRRCRCRGERTAPLFPKPAHRRLGWDHLQRWGRGPARGRLSETAAGPTAVGAILDGTPSARGNEANALTSTASTTQRNRNRSSDAGSEEGRIVFLPTPPASTPGQWPRTHRLNRA